MSLPDINEIQAQVIMRLKVIKPEWPWQQSDDNRNLYMKRIDALTRKELVILYHEIWRCYSTRKVFCTHYKINEGGFSRWLQGKKASQASVHALRQFLCHGFPPTMHSPFNIVNHGKMEVDHVGALDKLIPSSLPASPLVSPLYHANTHSLHDCFSHYNVFDSLDCIMCKHDTLYIPTPTACINMSNIISTPMCTIDPTPPIILNTPHHAMDHESKKPSIRHYATLSEGWVHISNRCCDPQAPPLQALIFVQGNHMASYLHQLLPVMPTLPEHPSSIHVVCLLTKGNVPSALNGLEHRPWITLMSTHTHAKTAADIAIIYIFQKLVSNPSVRTVLEKLELLCYLDTSHHCEEPVRLFRALGATDTPLTNFKYYVMQNIRHLAIWLVLQLKNPSTMVPHNDPSTSTIHSLIDLCSIATVKVQATQVLFTVDTMVNFQSELLQVIPKASLDMVKCMLNFEKKDDFVDTLCIIVCKVLDKIKEPMGGMHDDHRRL